MNLTPEQREQVATELKRFGADLQLSDDQKSKLQEFLTEARSKVADYLQANPNAKKSDILKQVAENRDQIRQRLVNFLSPEQLKKWDAEVSKAKEFLGQPMAA
jgi:periplasmic protein CpxP/Spy